MRIKIKENRYYIAVKALQVFLLCLFGFSSIVFSQSEVELMARVARSEGLDTSQAYRDSMADFKLAILDKYLFDDTLAQQQARSAYDKLVAIRGNKQLLVRQIFHTYSQHVRQTEINQWQQRMDSISQALSQGGDFEALMLRFSDDLDTRWISHLDMTDEFEKVAFDLQKGQVSPSFLSPKGIHIVQLVDERPLDFSSYASSYIQQLRENDQLNIQMGKQVEQLKKRYQYQENPQQVNTLLRNGKVDGVLFTLGGISYTGSQFNRFAQTYPMGLKRLFASFVTKCVLDYQASLMESSPAFAQEVQEAADKLLAVEAYRVHVKVPSQTDEAGLMAYFMTHKKDYYWDMPRFNGAVIHAADKKVAKRVRKIIKKLKGESWGDAESMLDDKTRNQVKVEQGIFAYGANAFVDEQEFGGRQAESLQDYPVAITVGKKMNGPDDYREVRDKLQQDYERFLYAEWLSALRKQK